jgi:hypothetical protein
MVERTPEKPTPKVKRDPRDNALSCPRIISDDYNYYTPPKVSYKLN